MKKNSLCLIQEDGRGRARPIPDRRRSTERGCQVAGRPRAAGASVLVRIQGEWSSTVAVSTGNDSRVPDVVGRRDLLGGRCVTWRPM